jgi:hypothetical protein
MIKEITRMDIWGVSRPKLLKFKLIKSENLKVVKDLIIIRKAALKLEALEKKRPTLTMRKVITI